MKVIEWLQERSSELKSDTLAVYLAYRDPRVSRWKKITIAIAIGYAFCPIDLIPDFIPILGYIDDLILVPIFLFVSIKLIPPDVLQESRERVRNSEIDNIPKGWKAATIIVSLWVLGILLVCVISLRSFFWVLEILAF